MKEIAIEFKRQFSIAALILLFFAALMVPDHTNAQFNSPNNRYLSISNSAPSVVVTHEFGFVPQSGYTVGSIQLEYCTSPVVTTVCVPPVGLDISGASLTGQSGETGFSVLSINQNLVVLSRTPAVSAGVLSRYILSNAVNPSTPNEEFYARLSYYSSNNASGIHIGRGAIVSQTTDDINLTTIVPPILYFCVATLIPIDCSSANGSLIDLGSLSSTSEASGTSQIMAQTNADFGYALSVNGTTMTSGNNIIQALTLPSSSSIGTAQFGINLRDNSSPNVGSEPIGVGIATPSPQYAIPNFYKFVNGDTIASSNDVSDYVKFTVSYLVNVPPDQKAGVYSTTLTYIITATF